MKKFKDAKEDIGSITTTSGFSTQLSHVGLNMIDMHLQELQFVVSSALAFDRSELEQKVTTINKV